MAWGSKTQIATTVTVDHQTAYDYGDSFTLNPGELASIQVKADFGASPDGNVACFLFTTLDDSSEDWDSWPHLTLGEIDYANDPGYQFAVVGGFYKARLGFLLAVPGTVSATVDAWIRKSGISV